MSPGADFDATRAELHYKPAAPFGTLASLESEKATGKNENSAQGEERGGPCGPRLLAFLEKQELGGQGFRALCEFQRVRGRCWPDHAPGITSRKYHVGVPRSPEAGLDGRLETSQLEEGGDVNGAFCSKQNIGFAGFTEAADRDEEFGRPLARGVGWARGIGQIKLAIREPEPFGEGSLVQGGRAAHHLGLGLAPAEKAGAPQEDRQAEANQKPGTAIGAGRRDGIHGSSRIQENRRTKLANP